jgi:hypothetical protein
MAVHAQWLDYPTPGVPRTADGKPNLSAPAPRTVDGKPDLPGMWGWGTRPACGAHYYGALQVDITIDDPKAYTGLSAYGGEVIALLGE